MVVNFGSHALLPGALAPLADLDVIVVDNFSSVAEQQQVRDLAARYGWTLTLRGRNDGFGAGANAGLQSARERGCDVAVLLNPDVVVERPVVDALVEHVRRDPGALVSPTLVGADGSSYFRGADLLTTTGRIRGHRPGRPTAPDARPWLTATCLAVPVTVLDRIGGFDPGYFLYWEDVDLSVRWVDAGGRLVVRGDLLARHDEGGTQGEQHGRAKSNRYYHWNSRNRLRFAADHLDPAARRRWVRSTPAVTWEIVLRGGRRQLLHSPAPVFAATTGAVQGWRRLRRVTRARRPAPVLVAHPGAELYGSDRVVLETVAGLVAAGSPVVVSLPGPGPLVAALEDLGAPVMLCRTPVLRRSALRPAGAARLLVDTAQALPTAISLVRRAEVVYVSTVTAPLWLLLGRLLGRAVVCHVHEAESSSSRLIQRLLYAPVALADTVVINSRFSRDVLLRAAPRLAARTVVIYNGIPGPPAVTPGRPVLAAPVQLLFVGRLSPRKGPQVAVAALHELVDRGFDVHLSLLGAVFGGYEWFEQELRDAVRAAGLTARVSFLGFGSDVWPVVAAADVVLVPSTVDEPFGNTAVEAVLAARPAVVSASGGLVEAGADYASTQLVRAGDATRCADAVARVIADWPTYRDAAVADRAVAHRRHAPARYRAEIVASIKATIAR